VGPVIPIIPSEVVAAGEALLVHYDNNYVKQRCMDFGKGKGKVFQFKDGAIALRGQPTSPSTGRPS
jgi:hypothetical protein